MSKRPLDDRDSDDCAPQKMARRRASAPVPLNQGGQKTCVAYAYAQALSQGLREKYGVPIDPDRLAEKIKGRHPCYKGAYIEQMLTKWNTQHLEAGAAIENLDARYHVKADAVRRIDNFEEAYRAMQKAEAQRMFMLCTIKTPQQGHTRHAVALQACVPGSQKMTAVNSWGANLPYLDVTSDNFVYACTFDPVIVAAEQGDKGCIMEDDARFPKPQEIYVARGKSEQERVEQVVAFEKCKLERDAALAGEQELKSKLREAETKLLQAEERAKNKRARRSKKE